MTTAAQTSFGSELRRLRARKGMTQRQLAEAASTHYTHVSRLESGIRAELSRDLLDRLGVALGAEAELASAARRLPTRLEALLCQYPAALTDDVLEERTLRSMRRLQAAAMAQTCLAGVPSGGVLRGRIAPESVLRQFRVRIQMQISDETPVTIETGVVTIRDPGGPDDPSKFPRVRFFLAHAAAHLLMNSPDCVFPRMPAQEQLACDIATQLLCPSGLLESAVREAQRGRGSEEPSPWASDPGELVADVATRLGIPSWLAIRRLADEALLDDDALYYSLGDQP
jgi:transcriptional regulator with XRE-family HTH domain